MQIIFFLPLSTSQSEEDKQLQEDLEMMVERLSVSIKIYLFLLLFESVKGPKDTHKTPIFLLPCRRRTQHCTVLLWKSCAD